MLCCHPPRLQNQMLHCLMPSTSARPNPSLSVPPHQVRSAEDTPRSSPLPSPTVNLTREYLALQTNSYSEIWSKIHANEPSCAVNEDSGQGEGQDEQQTLANILNPGRECIEEALRHARPNNLSRLVSTYFDKSENTFHLCLLLGDNVCRARAIYHDLHNLLDVLPLDSDSDFLTQPQCDRVYDVFLQFDLVDNPFPHPDSRNFNEIRLCFSQLNQQLHKQLYKSRSRVRHIRCATTSSAICLIGITVGVAISAVAVASHALIALVAGPLLPACIPSKITKKERAHLSQLDSAARVTFVLHNDLDTIDRLVERLHAAVEDDKLLIRLGLEQGRDRHPIHEVAKQLQKNHHNFCSQLIGLEEHICLCFTAINKTRALLLEEMHVRQSL